MSQVPTSSLSPRDLLTEAIVALMSRPTRSILTCLGTILGVGTLVTILGLTTTAQSQVSARFDALAASTITVEDHHKTTPIFTPEAELNVKSLNGVVSSGYYWPIQAANKIQASPQSAVVSQVSVTAASPGLFDAIGAELTVGTTFDAFHDDNQLPIAVVGEVAAARLNLPDLALQPHILINDRPYAVAGIIGNVVRLPELLSSVIIPTNTASHRFGPPTTSGANAASMLITTAPGAAQQVATEVPWAVTAQDLTQVVVVPPPDPRSLRESVDADLSNLLLTLAGICLFIGAVGIANTTLVAVMERIPEIGLRRSLGARRAHIFAHVLTESTMLGALGGLIGTTLGILTVLGISLAQGWTPVLDPKLAIFAPLIGLVVGAAAGIQPSWRASRIQPTEALRR